MDSAVPGTEPSIVRRLYLSESAKEKTFKYEDSLPALPLPDLKQTMQKYLASIEPFVSSDEYEKTKLIAEKFENGVGKVLQDKLKARASEHKNWMADWWLKYAYLMSRDPLAPGLNMSGPQSLHFDTWEANEETALGQGSLCLWVVLEFFTHLRKERIKPHSSRGGKKFSMDQFRYFFNTTRIPKEGIDEIKNYFTTESEGPCPVHMIVICRGHIWTMNPWMPSGAKLSVPELEEQMRYIAEVSEALGEGQGVGVLTFDQRELWAKNRRWLSGLSRENEKYLHMIDTALLVYTLDEARPKDIAEVCQLSLCGNPRNRWADKSHGPITFANGFHATSNDHTPYDAMVNVAVGHFQHGVIQDEFGGEWKGEAAIRDVRKPRRLVFTLDDVLLQSIERVKALNEDLRATAVADFRYFTLFGKEWLQEQKLHPDAFVQCALQLAYFQMHNKLAPTYETATTRQFHLGRTETVRSCTTRMADFVQAMVSTKASMNEKRGKLVEALRHHVSLLTQCQDGHGIDRHLMGLSIVAAESGIPTPDLFTDPSYTKSGGGGNYVLSTSTVGPTLVLGGVAAMVRHGYGVFYGILPDRIHFFLSCYTDGEGTCVKAFFQSLVRALILMREVVTDPQSRL